MAMSEVNLRKQIQLRLEEKRKVSSARKGYFNLLLVASGLIMLTFIRVSFLYNTQSIFIPVAFMASIGLLGLLVAVVWKAKSFISHDELKLGAVYLRSAIIIISMLVLMLVSGGFEMMDELRSLPRFSFGAILIFLSFYTFNLLFALGAMIVALKKLSNYEIHAMSLTSISRLFVLSIFLLLTLTAFILLTGL